MLIKNSSRANLVSDYSIVASNDYGQILGGLSAGFTNSNPWANFGTQPAVATCTDGIKNGTETDVDCGGGTCPKCGVGRTCATPSDCQSGVFSHRFATMGLGTGLRPTWTAGHL